MFLALPYCARCFSRVFTFVLPGWPCLPDRFHHCSASGCRGDRAPFRQVGVAAYRDTHPTAAFGWQARLSPLCKACCRGRRHSLSSRLHAPAHHRNERPAAARAAACVPVQPLFRTAMESGRLLLRLFGAAVPWVRAPSWLAARRTSTRITDRAEEDA